MSDFKGYVDEDYLQQAADLTSPVKEASYKRMHLLPGQAVLDVGCGPATDTITLARLLEPAGKVVGVDFDADMIALADERTREAGVSHQVTHRVEDALKLSFEDNQFDATRSERLFQHLQHPEVALSEMTRVTKPGGWIVVLDTDWATQSCDSQYTDLERRLARIHGEHELNNGYSGRTLYRLFKRQGLLDISIEPFALFTTNYTIARLIASLDDVAEDAVRMGIATKEECQCWQQDFEEADREGVFYASVCMVLAAGRKPA